MITPRFPRRIARADAALRRSPSADHGRRNPRFRALLLSLLAVLAFGLAWTSQASADSVDGHPRAAERSESDWMRISTAAQGQFLNELHSKLVAEHGQTEGDYDYSVVKKLSVSGTLNSLDYTNLRSTSYAGGSIEKLDLSGVVDATTFALSGMTSLTDVSLPPVASFTLANPFQGNASLRNVVVAAETYAFGSATTFNGITSLQRITFLHTTKPSMNASTFVGSNNADPENRTVTAVVPDKARGDYGSTAFTQYFTDVVEAASADDFAELQNVIDEASAIDEGSAAAEFRWTLLQQAIAAATSVHGNSSSTAAAVYRARLVLQTAMNRIGVSALGLSLKVTKGADVTLSWKNGTAQHFAEFTPRPVAKVDAFSDADHDVYVPTTTMTYVTQNIASAVIPGETDKVAKIFTMSAALAGAQHTLNLTPLEGREDTASLIPGLGAGDNRGLYTNLDDTGVVNLEVGDHFDLDTIRTQQAQLDQINNLFVEPEYSFAVSGDSVTTQAVGLDGRRQLRINAESPGVSVIKVTYGPLRYLAANDTGIPGNTNWSFNGIDPQNTGLVVVDVGGDRASFDTGIVVKNELDTYYFDKTVGERDFAFTPAEGTTVRVHDPLNVSPWGSGWREYEPASDGSFTVKLKGGRNVVELTNDGRVQYRVVRAKGVDVTVTNTTDPGQPFAEGDVARIAVTGVEGGVEKLAGIYNPAFVVGTRAKLTYYDGAGELVSNEAPQYQTAITTFNIDYTFTGAEDKALDGDMFIGGLGAEWPYHRQIPLEGKPANLAAVAIGPYHFGGMPTVYVHGDQVSTSPDSPGAPTDLQLTHGDGEAELSWVAPASTGGLPITGYIVRYSRDGGESWETRTFGTGTEQILTGLANGTEYEVQVAAVNGAGAGSFSASRSVTPRTVPGAPSDLTLTAAHEAIDLAWTAPESGGSTITGYQVRYSTDAGENWETRDFGVATEQTLTDLTDGVEYEVQVAAVNSEGRGAFSASATATPLGGGSVPEPTVSLSADATELRVGDKVKLTWTVDGADSVTAGGDWSGGKAASGSQDVVLERAGDLTFSLTATGEGGTTTAKVDVKVSLAPAKLTVKAPARLIHVGRSATVAVTGLAAGETYRITIGGIDVDSGVAPGTGSLSRNVVVPARLRDGTVPVRVRGSLDDRAGSTGLRVVAAKRLTVKVARAKVRKGKRQRVSVSGLAAGEPVRILYRGRRIAVRKASGRGTLTTAFPVGRANGAKVVRIYGLTNDRSGVKAFRVTR